MECTDGNKKLPLEKLGHFQWVSTSIARFIPSADWPPDLCFTLVINSKISTYDSITLRGVPDSQSYETSGLAMRVTEVLSKMSLAVTGGRWDSLHCDEKCAVTGSRRCEVSCAFHECPKDGIVLLQFSHPVVPSRVLSTLILDNGASLQDWVGSCSNALQEEQVKDNAAETPVRCVAVKPRDLRSDGSLHELTLPEFSRVTPLGISSTQRALTQRLSGVVPFKFHFKQKVIPNVATASGSQSYQFRPRYRRYKLHLIHGLRILVDAANAKQVRILSAV